MAKKTASAETKARSAETKAESAETPQASAEDIEAAAQTISNVTGLGIIPARDRARLTDPRKVARLAACHRTGDYTPAVEILYG